MTVKILPPSVEYAPLLHKWRSEERTLKFNPVKPRTLEQIQEALQKAPTDLALGDDPADQRWFVECDGEVVGTVSLAQINRMMGTAEIGYMVGQDHHGRGIASAAVKTWTAMIFRQTNLRKLTASVAEGNRASLRVLEKSGYRVEGLLKEHYLIREQPTNEVVFGLLRHEWTE